MKSSDDEFEYQLVDIIATGSISTPAAIRSLYYRGWLPLEISETTGLPLVFVQKALNNP